MCGRFLPRPLSLATLAFGLAANAQVSDDFSDGDFTAGTVWSGSTSLFTVVDDGGDQRLRSNSPTAANYHLSTPSTIADDVQWELFIDLRFATSGVNYADIYLMSDAADLSGGVNGYFLRMGGTQDRLELFKVTGGTATALGLQSADGIVNSSSGNPFRIKVMRSAGGTFTLFHDDGNTGTYANAGAVSDLSFTTTTHFGIRIEQSSAASVVNRHFFDDVLVQPIPVDGTPPSLVSAAAVDADRADLVFSEAVDAATAGVASNYALDCGVTVNNASLQNATTVRITFAPGLANGTTCVVTVNGVEDLAGNAAVNASASFTWSVPDVALPGEVVINEIMADPSPVVGLPDAEFVELFNTTSGKYFDLGGWRITTLSTQATLPAHTLAPGDHVVFVNNAQLANFAGIPNVRGWSLSNTALLNAGTTLTLEDPGNVVIDAIAYSSTWYGDDVKDDGGWTLERINPFAPCSDAANWTASNDERGGSPGIQNSVFDDTPDTQAPVMNAVQVVSPTEIVLVFNEGLDPASITGATYAIDPPLDVQSIQPVAPANDRIRLVLGTAMQEGVIHTITAEGLADCSGNVIAPSSGSFALPQATAPLDIVINEVLYDPVGSGSDFVELYNRSSKFLSLGGLQMANESNGEVANYRLITPDPVILMPGEYILLATNATDIATRYPQSRTDRFLQMSLPSYNNGSGTVVLADADNNVIDLFRYSDKMHFTLVNKPEGYSLERINPDRPTSDNTNWQTASDIAGKATPGFRNSQYAPTASPSGEMTIDPAIFSPDNDGYQDVLTVIYRFDQPGFVGNLSVFDIAGREVRKLMENQLLGTEGAISWDGILDGGSKGRMGPYIVFLEVFDLEGNAETYRKTVTLAHRLD